MLKDAGAKSVTVVATHGVLSGPAVERLKNSGAREVVLTDTVPIPEEKRWDGLTVLSIAPLLASAIRAVFEDGSVVRHISGASRTGLLVRLMTRCAGMLSVRSACLWGNSHISEASTVV